MLTTTIQQVSLQSMRDDETDGVYHVQSVLHGLILLISPQFTALENINLPKAVPFVYRILYIIISS